MDQPEKTAIVLGATGLTGGLLLDELLHDPRYSRIVVFSRSTAGIQHPKYEEYLGNLFNLSDFSSKFTADEVYCCVGTTKAKTPDKEKYRKIDLGIPLNAAQLCLENKIDTFIVISSLGASPKSSVFYSRVKGEMEEAVLQLGLPKIHIMQPSLISGEREESRSAEKLAKTLFSFLNTILIGPLKKYRSVQAKDIARAMIWLANNEYGQKKITSDKITELANA